MVSSVACMSPQCSTDFMVRSGRLGRCSLPLRHNPRRLPCCRRARALPSRPPCLPMPVVDARASSARRLLSASPGQTLPNAALSSVTLRSCSAHAAVLSLLGARLCLRPVLLWRHCRRISLLSSQSIVQPVRALVHGRCQVLSLTFHDRRRSSRSHRQAGTSLVFGITASSLLRIIAAMCAGLPGGTILLLSYVIYSASLFRGPDGPCHAARAGAFRVFMAWANRGCPTTWRESKMTQAHDCCVHGHGRVPGAPCRRSGSSITLRSPCATWIPPVSPSIAASSVYLVPAVHPGRTTDAFGRTEHTT